MIKLDMLSSFFERCDELSEEYGLAFLEGEYSTWNDAKIAKYINGPVKGLYLEGDEELLSYLCQKCNQDEMLRLIKRRVDISNNNPMTKIGRAKGYLELTQYPSRDDNLCEWLKNHLYLDIDVLDKKDIESAVAFFFLSEGFDQYRETRKTEKYLGGDCAIISLYGEVVSSNYNLIPIGGNIELLNMFPVRIYDKEKNKTIYVDIVKKLAEIFNRLVEEEMLEKLSVKGIGNRIFDGRKTGEVLCENIEKGSIFSLQSIGSLPAVTKLYSREYENQLWVSANGNDLTFEELCEDFQVQWDGVRTQMIHLQYKIEGENTLISHMDHEYIFYSIDEYEKRKKDGKMKTKGTKHKRVKTFKIDGGMIPIDYPCKMYRANDDGNEEVQVPFLLFVIDTFFEHKDLIEEYFAEMVSNIKIV